MLLFNRCKYRENDCAATTSDLAGSILEKCEQKMLEARRKGDLAGCSFSKLSYQLHWSAPSPPIHLKSENTAPDLDEITMDADANSLHDITGTESRDRQPHLLVPRAQEGGEETSYAGR